MSKDDDLSGHVVITGGAGFIGTNLAHRLASLGQSVVIIDNLARSGVERNVRWLRQVHGSSVTFVQLDCRDARALTPWIVQSSCVFHLAAQVAVTTSLREPLVDFEVNAGGTLKLLEIIRQSSRPIPVIFTSTNKVYGALSDIQTERRGVRIVPTDHALRESGIDEKRSLEFHSPYGCSKGAADQYVLDYARTFGLAALVFRMSCIYGPHQFGTEDQGWVAHFLLRTLAGQPITIYGDGLQVRDVLFVEDLIDAFLIAKERARELSGNAYNIGGGPNNAVSLLELLDEIETLTGRRSDIEFEPPRMADQRYYVTDFTRMSEMTGWKPATGIRHGLERLFEWARQSTPITTAKESSPQLSRAAGLTR